MADPIVDAIAYIRSKVPATPDLGIICGSGLGELHSLVGDRTVIRYSDIPGFPQSTVSGHKSELVCGTLNGKTVLLMRGRFHCYEGYKPSLVSFPIQVMAALGVRMLIITNAAGGVNKKFEIGDFMIIQDHISFPGLSGGAHPLVGKNDERFGPRFPAITPSYNKDFQALFESTAEEAGLGKIIRRGTYCGVSGPSYETPAEISLMRSLGGDSVGMSTVPEVIAAAHCSLPILGVSLISNRCKGTEDTDYIDPTHTEVLESVAAASTEMLRLMKAFVGKLDVASLPRPRAYDLFSSKALEARTDATAEPAASSSSSSSSSSGGCSLSSMLPSVISGAIAGGLVAVVAVLAMRSNKCSIRK